MRIQQLSAQTGGALCTSLVVECELSFGAEKAGTPIGPNDTLIAAHALALDCTLVTDIDAEFLRMPGLRVENWLTGTGA